MTDEAEKTGKKKEKEKENFLSHSPAIVAAAVGTVFAAILGSFLGKTGTIAGMTAGSLISGSITWWAERGIRKSAAIAKAKRDAARKKGRPLTVTETAVIERVTASNPRWQGIHWRQISIFTIVALILSALTVGGAEALASRSFHGFVLSPPRPAPVTSYVTMPPRVITETPGPSPDLTSGTSSASPSPDVSPSMPVSVTPAASPDITPVTDPAGTPTSLLTNPPP